jgi:hypothetical protein
VMIAFRPDDGFRCTDDYFVGHWNSCHLFGPWLSSLNPPKWISSFSGAG